MLTTFALDTATPSPALAIVADGTPIAELGVEPTPAGGRRVLECVHRMVTAADIGLDTIDRVVVGVGPGGFTGLRIGIATAMGLGQALEVPVVGASSLEALALGAGAHVAEGVLVAPVIDARRREVFAALYRTGPGADVEEMIAPGAMAPPDFIRTLLRVSRGEEVHLAGDGVAAFAGDLAPPYVIALPPGSPGHRIRAADLVRRVDAGAGRAVVPQYLRLPDAEVNRRRAEMAARERPAA